MTIGNLIASIAVLITAIALYYQIWRSRFSMNLELVLKREDKFDSPEFRKIRSSASNSILNGTTIEKFKEAEDVFDFFETIGYFVKHKALDREIVWHTFYHWVHLYWSAGKEYILIFRQKYDDPTYWEDFECLHNTLLKIQESKTRNQEPEILSQEKIIEFLNDELLNSELQDKVNSD